MARSRRSPGDCGSTGSVPAVVRALEAEPLVLAAQPNYLYGSQELHVAGRMHTLATPVAVARPAGFLPTQEQAVAVDRDRR